MEEENAPEWFQKFEIINNFNFSLLPRDSPSPRLYSTQVFWLPYEFS